MEPDFFYSIFGNITVYPITVSAIISLSIGLLLLVCSAIISGSEVAFFSLEPQDIDELETSDKKTDQHILRLIKSPQRLLATILIGNNFVNVAIILLFTHFTNSILNFESSPIVGFIFQTIIITFALLLFGEIIPKVYATQFGKKTALFTVPIISGQIGRAHV